MKPPKQTGFTIVETMLFLAISGLLVMAILVGTGTAINIQRYRDSVSSIGAFMQQQYSDVANVNNDGSDDACPVNAPLGQSDCVILGKYITTKDSKTLQVKTIIGTNATINPGVNDVTALIDSKIKISSMAGETYDVDWGASMDFASGTAVSPPDGFSILILRSPVSGIIRTFIDDQKVISEFNVGDLLSSAALNKEAKVCVNSNGLFTGTKMAVLVQSHATSSSDVILLGDKSECH
jgi:type II secretory pathway pseudopilin PulG